MPTPLLSPGRTPVTAQPQRRAQRAPETDRLWTIPRQNIRILFIVLGPVRLIVATPRQPYRAQGFPFDSSASQQS